MNKRCTLAGVVILAFLTTSSAIAGERIYRGRVIDFETKEPIAGAAVVVYWNEAVPTISGEKTRLKEVKETVTDYNGKWAITGEEGQRYDPNPYLSFMTGTYYTREPLIIIFKPGYCPWPKGFFIDACEGRMMPGGTGEMMETGNAELSTLTEKKDRLRAIPEAEYDGTDPQKVRIYLKKQINLLRLIDEERRNLGLKEFETYRELENEK